MNQEFFERTKSIFDLSGRVAIVTGAARGLGRIMAFSLSAFGATVVLASRSGEELKAVESEVKRLGGEALAITTDITREDQVDRMVAETMSAFGRIDILINNSAVSHRIRAEEMGLDKWQAMMDTNLTGTFLCSQRVGRVMIPRKRERSSISPPSGENSAVRRTLWVTARAKAESIR